MHLLPSAAILRKYRLASILVVLGYACLPVAVGFLLYGYLNHEIVGFVVAGVSLLLALFCIGMNFVICGRLRCPLCVMPPLQNRSCSKHRNVQRILGSHRLKVATMILFRSHFRCPYCGEPTRMAVRQRGRK